MMTYAEFKMGVTAWARQQPDVRAVLIVGSNARTDYPADRWSDLDLIVLTRYRDRLVHDSAWLHGFGEVWLTYRESTAPGDPEWYVVYEGGVKVDVVLLEIAPFGDAQELETLLAHHPYRNVFRRGTQVLFDREGSPRTLSPQPILTPAPPTAVEFDNVISGMLMASLTTAKFIARGDLWRAQRWFTNDLHPQLLRLIEWHAQAMTAGIDTWYAGRFMEQWADERVLAAVPQVFATFDRTSLQAALIACLDLVRWLGAETADKLGFEYPLSTHHHIQSAIEQMRGDTRK